MRMIGRFTPHRCPACAKGAKGLGRKADKRITKKHYKAREKRQWRDECPQHK